MNIPTELLSRDIVLDGEMARLYLALLLKANGNDSVDIRQRTFAAEIRMSYQTLRTLLKRLESTQLLTQQPTQLLTHITFTQTKNKRKQPTQLLTQQPTQQGNVSQPPNGGFEGFERFRQYYNDLVSDVGIPQIKEFSTKRRAALNAIFKEFGKEKVDVVLRKVISSEYLTVKWGRVNVDWIFNRNNFIKIYEGTYDNRTDNPANQSSGRGQHRAPDALDLAREILGESARRESI